MATDIDALEQSGVDLSQSGTQPAVDNTPVAPSTPTPTDSTSNIQQLAAAHPWLPPSTLFGLADQGVRAGSDVVGAIEGAASASGQFADHVFGDPVLQKKQSLALGVSRYINQAVGPWPVQQSDVSAIQSNLQKQGYGKDLQASGAWGPEWVAAWNEWKQALVRSQLAGNQPGGKSAGGVLHWLSAVLPKEAGNAIVGFAQALPGQARNMLADIAAGAADVGSIGANIASNPGSIAGGHPLISDDARHQAMAAAGGNVERFLGANQSNDRYAQQAFGAKDASMRDASYRTTGGRLFDDLSTMFLITGVLGAGKGIASGIALAGAKDAAETTAQAEGRSIFARAAAGFGERGAGRVGALQDLGLGDAYRGPGTIARTLGRVTDIGDAKFLKNIPVMERVGPWVGKLNDADGLYYRARTLVATPYVYQPVQTAGRVMGSAGVVGAEARGVAAVSGKINPDSPLASDIQQSKVLNPLDDAIRNRLSFTAWGHHFNAGLDDLALFLHPPHALGDSHVPGVVGSQAHALLDAYDSSLGKVGALGELDRGLRGYGGTTLNKLYDRFGELEGRKWSTDKLKQFAASSYAENSINQGIASGTLDAESVGKFGSPEWIKTTRDLEHQAWTDPATMHTAIRQMMSNPGELTSRLGREIVKSGTDPLAYMQREWEDYSAASKVLKQGIIPNQDALIHSRMFVGGQDAADTTIGTTGLQIGMARYARNADEVGTLTRSGALNAANDFEQRFGQIKKMAIAANDAASTAQATDTITQVPTSMLDGLNREVNTFLTRELGVDAERMPGGFDAKVAKIRAGAEMLADDLHPGPDAPKEVFDSIKQLKEIGFKPVVGTDIGHRYLPDDPIFDNYLDGAVTKRRSIAGMLGLDPSRYANATVSQTRYLGVKQSLQEAVDAGKLSLPPYYTVDTLISDLRDANLIDPTPGRFTRAIASLFAPSLQDLKEDIGMLPGATPEEVRQLAKQKFAEDALRPSRLADLRRKNVVEALTSDTYPNTDVESGIRRFHYNKSVAPGDWNTGPHALSADVVPTDVLGDHMPSGGLANPDAVDAMKTTLHDNGFAKPVVVHFNPESGQAVLDQDGAVVTQAAKEVGMQAVPVRVVVDRAAEGAEVQSRVPLTGQVRDGRTIATARVFPDYTGGDNMPGEIEPNSIPRFTKDQANQIYRLVLKGSASPPGYMMGLTHLEDMFRAFGTKFGFMGSVLPGDLGDMMANLPNRLIQMRDEFRFDVNPEFSLRRIAKTNVKMALEDIAPTMRPYQAMSQASTLQEDRALAARLNGWSGFADDFDKTLRANDIFFLYNPRDFESYAAGQLQRAGYGDNQIKERLTRIFDYGTYSGGVEGRTSIEKSANFVFFPFSFDKTLYRNLGAYLLDRPGQLMALQAGLAAYHQFSESVFGQDYIEKYAPLMDEVLNLNAFSHGLSVGEVGGVNRPLLNMFLPQSWKASPDANKTLGRLVPAMKQLQDTWKKAYSQGHIVTTGVGNLADDLQGKPSGTFTNIRHAAESSTAQVIDAQKMYLQLQQRYQPILDWNTKHRNKAQQYKLNPNDPVMGEFGGQVVSKSLLRDVVAKHFPQWNPDAGAVFAVQNDAALRRYRYTLKGSPNEALYNNLIDAATKVRDGILHDTYKTPQQVTRDTAIVRRVAVQLAEQDSTFYQVWKRSFSSSFGPLEDVTPVSGGSGGANG